jgi:hypothetical protein
MPRKYSHPFQPLAKDKEGTIRFKENKLVSYLARQFGLNKLALMNFSAEDYEQLAQLLGYSLGGFAELSYVREDTLRRAENTWDGNPIPGRES